MHLKKFLLVQFLSSVMAPAFIFFVLFVLNITQGFSSGILPENERIITDLEIIYGNQGVAIDYSYNETTNNNGTSSVPGCPKSIDGIPWIYYGNPPRCFLAGHYGPCPLVEKLLAMKSSYFGVCACECIVDKIQIKSAITDFILQQVANKERYIFCSYHRKYEESSINQIYDSKDKICYETQTQGPCNNGKILVGVRRDKPKCVTSCQHEDGSLGFLSGNSCGWFPEFQAGAYYVNEHNCSINEKLSDILQKCIKKEKFFLF